MPYIAKPEYDIFFKISWAFSSLRRAQEKGLNELLHKGVIIKSLSTIGFLILILLSGCTRQANFNKSNAVTIKLEKKYYTLPRGTNYSSAPIDSKIAKKMNRIGIPCVKHDLIWMTPRVKKSIDRNEQINVKSIYGQGLIGCAHPHNKPIDKSTYAYTRKRIYTCSQLSKSQAYALLRAGHTYLDRDHDGHPCEWGRQRTRSYYKPTYRSNCHYVRGYYRRSGTYVRGYTRCR